jgi:rod shape determining protein RodA
MRQLLGVLGRTDGIAIVAWFGLVLTGLAALYSCTVDFKTAGEVVGSTVSRSVFYSQLTWVGIGVAVAAIALAIPFRFFETFAYLFYGIAIVSLIALFVVGTERVGTNRWLVVGPFSVQPSELAKAAMIFALARFLAARNGRRPIVMVIGVVFLVMPAFLLVLKQPDLGTSLVFLALAVPMLYWAGVRASFLLALFSPVVSALVMFYGQQLHDSTWPWVVYVLLLLSVLFFSRLYMFQSIALIIANVAMGLSIPLVWAKLKPYQQARILTFFKPEEGDQLGTGYQAFQSKVAIGSGGMLGKGYLQGSQKGLAFLPERHTDFIFSVVGEEFGLLGAIVVLGLFSALIYRAVRIAVQVKRPFGSGLAIGVATYFAFQALVNISITVGLLPVTGLPLPFLSYGGSSMLASCLMVGLLLNVSARWSEV